MIDDQFVEDALQTTGLQTKREAALAGPAYPESSLPGSKTIDTVVAARWIESGCSPLHADHAFEAFELHFGSVVVDSRK